MGSEKLIHIKLEHSEAIKSKRDILSSEANLLTVLRTMKRYHPLRMQELKTKIKVGTKIKEILADIRKLEKTLPTIKVPKILQEHQPEEMEELEEIESKISDHKTRNYDNDLESQLEDIKIKLRELAD